MQILHTIFHSLLDLSHLECCIASISSHFSQQWVNIGFVPPHAREPINWPVPASCTRSNSAPIVVQKWSFLVSRINDVDNLHPFPVFPCSLLLQSALSHPPFADFHGDMWRHSVFGKDLQFLQSCTSPVFCSASSEVSLGQHSSGMLRVQA